MTQPRSSRHPRGYVRRGIRFGLLSFILTLLIILPSRQATQHLSLLGGVAVIVAVVALGVLGDMLGVAAASASEAPFHAMAARKVTGARQALRLVRNADQISTLFADVVGDVAGTVSGAAAAAVVLRFFRVVSDVVPAKTVVDALVVALAASLTVGGKAACKELALRKSTDVLMVAGKILWWVERYFNLAVLEDR